MSNTSLKTGYAQVNGLHIYHEIHGEGEPLILLHGGLCSTCTFGPVLSMLAKTRQVIAVDLQGHGRTADVDRPLDYDSMADDIVGLTMHLGIRRCDVMGYSLGGGVALRFAIRHPQAARKLVVVSMPFQSAGWYPEIRAGISLMGPATAAAMKESPLYKRYSAIAPKPDDWPALHVKLRDLLTRDFDWSREVAAIKIPAMIVVTDADAVRTEHAVKFFELLGGGRRDGGWDGSGMSASRLAILPGLTHYNIVSSPALALAVEPFLSSAVAKADRP